MRKMTLATALIIILGSTPATSEAISQRPQLVDATETEIQAIRSAFTLSLKDAESAKFKGVRREAGERGGTTCGYINAKNSYGAYSGFRLFHAQLLIMPTDPSDIRVFNAVVDEGESSLATQFCRDAGLTP